MAKSIKRLISLDIFRGLTVAFMIIVNTPGSWKYIYPPFRHSSWDGCTPADMVFPFFLFIAGVSMWYSLKKYKHSLSGESAFRILRRVVAIFAVGLFLAVFPYFGRDYSTLRIMGVLQRIALAYGLAAFVCLSVNRQYLWIVVAVLLVSYWALLAFPGGTHPYGLEGNIVSEVDTAILGANHLYNGFGIPFDPEGLLSTIPASATVIIGFYCGAITAKKSDSGSGMMKILLLGIGLTGLGYLWGMVFPINKPLWTSSYVLYTAGLAMIILSFLYLVADHLKFQKWGLFFTVLGTNALVSFFLAGILVRLLQFFRIRSGNAGSTLYTWIYENICAPFTGKMGGSLMFAIIALFVIWLAAFVLYRKKIMIRL
jgi:predicted acyltransferase